MPLDVPEGVGAIVQVPNEVLFQQRRGLPVPVREEDLWSRDPEPSGDGEKIRIVLEDRVRIRRVAEKGFSGLEPHRDDPDIHARCEELGGETLDTEAGQHAVEVKAYLHYSVPRSPRSAHCVSRMDGVKLSAIHGRAAPKSQ